MEPATTGDAGLFNVDAPQPNEAAIRAKLARHRRHRHGTADVDG